MTAANDRSGGFGRGVADRQDPSELSAKCSRLIATRARGLPPFSIGFWLRPAAALVSSSAEKGDSSASIADTSENAA